MARIYEYQGKEVLKRRDAVPKGKPVKTPGEAEEEEVAVEEIGKPAFFKTSLP